MNKIPRGIPCLTVIIIFFGYLSSVMGFTNMLNTISTYLIENFC